ncbi:hypothetical protein [Streptomyces sp. NRRL B-1347]|uniref:hypothetical protein n=1 Tax=Streptomyces sp. NRRL B-1347 TaxID=1476877 RepID=UPI00068F6BCA|nr:hypothetical protein [Streptomyces sp. NRRL B-1347]
MIGAAAGANAQSAETWLLRSAPEADRAMLEWHRGGIALLRCGQEFAAVRMAGALVEAAVGSKDLAQAAAYLCGALRGPVFMDLYPPRYYALVPPSTAPRPEWRVGRQFVELLGGDTFLGVPRVDRVQPEGVHSYWCVPVDRSRGLCSVTGLDQLVARGRCRLPTREVTGE